MNLEELIKESDEIREIVNNMPMDIKERCRIKHFEPDTVILRKMDEIKYVYILCKGECCVMNEFKEGYLYVFGRKKGIHFIGEQAILADQLEAAVTIQTVTDCILIKLSRQDFWKWIQNDHTCTIILLKHLAKRLYPVSKDRGMIRYYPSIYLLKKFLIKEYAEYNGDCLSIKKTRQQIADEIGVSLRSVERGIKTLKNDNLINIVKGKIYMNQSMYENLLNEVDD